LFDILLVKLPVESIKEFIYKNNSDALPDSNTMFTNVFKLRPEVFDSVDLDASVLNDKIWRKIVLSDRLRSTYGVPFVLANSNSIKTVRLALQYDNLPREVLFSILYQTALISYYPKMNRPSWIKQVLH
jgi:hypothetical protein